MRILTGFAFYRIIQSSMSYKYISSLQALCIKTEGFIFFLYNNKTGWHVFDYIIASDFDFYHSVKHILFLSCLLSLW